VSTSFIYYQFILLADGKTKQQNAALFSSRLLFLNTAIVYPHQEILHFIAR